MRRTFSILLLCVPLVCAGQSVHPTQADSLVLEFRKSEFEVYRNLEKVPKSFVRFINQNGWRISMVDYGKDYNSTDIQSNHLPNCMLIELGISEDDLYVMLFDHGGYSTARRAFIFRKVGKVAHMSSQLLQMESRIRF